MELQEEALCLELWGYEGVRMSHKRQVPLEPRGPGSTQLLSLHKVETLERSQSASAYRK